MTEFKEKNITWQHCRKTAANKTRRREGVYECDCMRDINKRDRDRQRDRQTQRCKETYINREKPRNATIWTLVTVRHNRYTIF